MSEHLKPCPFCGAYGEDLLIFCDPEEAFDNSGPSRRIQCARCFVEAPFYAIEGEAIAAWNRRADRPASPDLQAEAERVFADVQRAVLVKDAKAEIAKALQATKDEATEAAAVRYRQLWTNDYPSELSSNRVRHLVRALRAIRNLPQLDA